MRKILYLVIISTILTGCSVMMAGAKPTKPIEKQKVIDVKTREQFEEKISNHVIEEQYQGDNKLVTYEKWYDKGAKVRMFIYLGLDVVTLGWWEILGSLGELNTNPTNFYDLEVLYDPNGYIIDANAIERIKEKDEVPGLL